MAIPKDAQDFVARGDAYVVQGDLVRAIAAYTDAIRLVTLLWWIVILAVASGLAYGLIVMGEQGK